MGKQIRRIVQLITLLAWLCTVTAFAVDMPTVIYDSGKGTFTFQNLDNDGLFGAFQDLMPGDERTTEIRIEMKNLSRSARLYLQAEPNSEDVEVLKTLKLSVKKNGAALDESNGAFFGRADYLSGSCEKEQLSWQTDEIIQRRLGDSQPCFDMVHYNCK